MTRELGPGRTSPRGALVLSEGAATPLGSCVRRFDGVPANSAKGWQREADLRHPGSSVQALQGQVEILERLGPRDRASGPAWKASVGQDWTWKLWPSRRRSPARSPCAVGRGGLGRDGSLGAAAARPLRARSFGKLESPSSSPSQTQSAAELWRAAPCRLADVVRCSHSPEVVSRAWNRKGTA
jgi:hypothetical protein